MCPETESDLCPSQRACIRQEPRGMIVSLGDDCDLIHLCVPGQDHLVGASVSATQSCPTLY